MAGCNNTSVGVLVERDGKLLLLERKNIPLGYAPPAGHVKDGETYEEAAVRELQEEVGLQAQNLSLVIEGRKEFGCKHGSTWHYWKLYKADVNGEIKKNDDEAKQVGWFTTEEIKKLQNPGLDPVMGVWFKELGII